MRKSAYIEELYGLLETAVEQRIIREWTVQGPDVLLRRGSVELAVPVLEAAAHVNDLIQNPDQTAEWRSAYVPA